MRRFLRFFGEFRKMEDDSREWRVRLDAATARIQELNDRLVEESHKVADTMALHAIGKRIYSRADPVPADYQPATANLGTRQQGRAAVIQKAIETQQEFERLFKETHQ